MRILVCVSEYYPYGAGIANVAYNVVEQLRKMGVDCTVCSPTGPDIKLGSSSMIARYGRLGLLYYWHRVAKYFKARADDHDVAWLHYPLFLRQNPFKRCLVTIHSTARGLKYPSYLYIYKKISSGIEKYCLNKIGDKVRFTAVSHQSQEELKAIGAGHKEITHIPNGVDIGKFRPCIDKKALRSKFNIQKDAIVLLSIGRLVYHKMPFKLIDIFYEIQNMDEKYMLVIAGKGELFDQVKEYAVSKNISNIKFLGFVSDDYLPDLYACSDFFITTSKYEGGEPTLTVAEAMASGLPCIVSDIPNRRVIENAQCGLAVDFSDEEKVAQKILSYLREDHAEHSRNAREYAVSNLDWKLIAERYLEEFGKS
ncbi:MAG: glycosyltransferase family 4 protein [Candidatus Hodarchaeota archaeon]